MKKYRMKRPKIGVALQLPGEERGNCPVSEAGMPQPWEEQPGCGQPPGKRQRKRTVPQSPVSGYQPDG